MASAEASDVSVAAHSLGIANIGEVTGGSFIFNFYAAAAPLLPASTIGPIPPCPYKGLAFFGPGDTNRFFGRDAAVKRLTGEITQQNFTALVGASGSGKSSVVLAGLAPRLHAGNGWEVTYFRIGSETEKNPFLALARALAPLMGVRGPVAQVLEETQRIADGLSSGRIAPATALGQCRVANVGRRILVIADQFEEAFTLVADESLRSRFIDFLLRAFPRVGQASPDVALVLTLRADFYEKALLQPGLAEALQDRVINLGPMSRDELREAIERPAAPVIFEPGLVETLLDEVEAQPGALPLLQFALTEMWACLRGPEMTRTSYEAIGGVKGALRKRADAIYARLTTNGGDVAAVARFRALFTRLVNFGEGAADTRRAAGHDELGADVWRLAQDLAGEDNRLVVVAAPAPGKETVEIAHEALIANWPALRASIDADRAFGAWLKQLRAFLEEHRRNPEDEGGLLRGGLLAVAMDWQERRRPELSVEERAFIDASERARDADAARRKAEQERRIHLAAAAAASRRVAQRTTIGLAVAILLALGAAIAGLFAHTQTVRANIEARRASGAEREATTQKNLAVTASEEARKQRDKALASELQAITTQGEMQILDKEPTAATESLLAVLSDDAVQADGFSIDRPVAVLAAALAAPRPAAILTQGGDIASFSDNAQRFAVAANGVVTIYRTDTWAQASQLKEQKSGVKTISFSPDGNLIAIGYDDGRVVVADSLSSIVKFQVAPLADGNVVTSIAFSPDGGKLLVTENAGMILADLNGGAPRKILPGHPGGVLKGVFSPDGRYIGTVGLATSTLPDHAVKMWSAFDLSPIANLSMPNWALSMAFSPDGARVAVGGDSTNIRVWNLPTGDSVNGVDIDDSNIGWLTFLNASTIMSLGGQLQIEDLNNSDSRERVDVGKVSYGQFFANRLGQAAKLTDGVSGLLLIDPTSSTPALNYRYKDSTFRAAAMDNSGSFVAGLTRDAVVIWKLPPRASSSYSPPRMFSSQANLEYWGISLTGTPVVASIVKSAPKLVVARTLPENAESWETTWTTDGPGFVQCYVADNGKRIAVVEWRNDGWQVSVADVTPGSALKPLAHSKARVYTIDFDDSGDRLAVSYRDGEMDLYSADGGDPLARLRVKTTYGQERGAITSDGRYIARVGEDHLLTVVDSATQTKQTVPLGSENNDLAYLTCIDDVFVFQTEGAPAQMWDAANNRGLGVLAPKGDNLTFAGKSIADGERLAYATEGGSIVVLDHKYKPLFHLKVTGRPTSLWFGDAEDVILIQFDDQHLEYWSLSHKIKLAQAMLGDKEGGLSADWSTKRFRAVYSDGSARNITLPFSPGLWQSLLDAEAKSKGAIIDYGRMAALEAKVPDVVELDANATSVQICDTLAANPFDPQRTATGVYFDRLAADRALAACEAASSADPSNGRLKYQYGRALAKAGRAEDANKMYQESAAGGYLYASYILATNAPDNLAVLQDLASKGVAIAYADIGMAHFNARDYDKALTAWTAGAAKSIPQCDFYLGRLFAAGVGGHFNLDASLRHFARASIFYQRLGAESDAFARERGSLVRGASPDLVARNVQAALGEIDGKSTDRSVRP